MNFSTTPLGAAAFKQSFHDHDWATSSIGPREQWPYQLSLAVEVMLDSVQPMFIVWGEKNHILFNGPFTHFLRSPWNEMLGARLPELLSPIWSSVEPFIAAAYEGKAGIAEDIPLKTVVSEFKETGYYTFASAPFRGRDGRVVGASIICTDTTAKVEERLRIKSERDATFRIFEEAPGFVAMVEGRDHRFVFANAAYLKLVDREKVVGLTVDEVLPELRNQEITTILQEVFVTGRRYVAMEIPLRLDGRAGASHQFYLDFVFAPMRNSDGEVYGIFVEGHDVTEKVIAEAEVVRLQSERIHTNRLSAMGAMASTIAHELNQPLGAISMYLSASQRLLQTGGDPAQIAEAVSRALENTGRAGKIIQSVQEFTRGGEVKRESVPLSQVIKEAGALAEAGACQGVELDYIIPADLAVLGDPIQIQQVILNLIKNSCESIDGAREKQVVISSRIADGMARVYVDDSGHGIPPEELAKVFDAFHSTKGDGMGIGLAICRTIIEAHGGKIWAENMPEGGARFCFTLPLAGTASSEK